MLGVSGTQVPKLLSTLRKDFPLSKPMWQVVRDTRDGLMEANLFTDEWPNYTTVISQEIAPRLSEVADIRIYTRNKEKVMPVINGAEMLKNTGKWQTIFFDTSVEEPELSQCLQDALRQLPSVKDSILSSYKLKHIHVPDETPPPPISIPEGYVLKDLLPEHAELVAKYWTTQNPFLATFPVHLKVQYLRELIIRYGALGMFTEEDPTEPIGWVFRKNGGEHGIAYTKREHRAKKMFTLLATELHSRSLLKEEILTVSGTWTSVPPPYELMGLSHIILLQALSNNT